MRSVWSRNLPWLVRELTKNVLWVSRMFAGADLRAG
jgi:hypothetical protein